MPALGTHPLATDVVFAEQFSTGGFPRNDDTNTYSIALFGGATVDSASLLFDGDAYARVASNLGLTYPYTIACEVWLAASTGSFLGVTWADGDYVLLDAGSGRTARASSRAAYASGQSESGVDAIGSGVWTPVAAVYTSATSRQVWVNGSFAPADTTNLTPSGTADPYFTIGALTRGGGAVAGFMGNTNRIRNVIVWQGATNGAMTDTKLDQWAADPGLPYSSGTPAPVLTSPSAGTPGTTSITIQATSDRPSDGTMRFLRRVGGSPASDTTIASTGESQAATANPQARTMTGFTPGSANNFVDYIQVGAGGNSNVVSVGPFTMAAGGVAPSVTTNPSNQSVTAGATATFTAAATGTPTPTVQWQRNGVDISGATSTSYTTPATTVSGGSANNGDTYRAGFTNASGGPVYTSAATLTVSAAGVAPTITVQPSSQTVTAGATATFSVTATGSGLTYQWRRNGTPIGGATSSSYSLSTVLGDNGAVISVVVTGDTAPPATSSNATLTVNAPPPPPPPSTFTALTDIIAESGIPKANTLVFFTWCPAGRPGAITGPVNSSVTTDAAGRALISHSVAGAGLVIIGTRPGPVVSNDRIFAQFMTLA